MPAISKLKTQMAARQMPAELQQAVFAGLEELDDHCSKREKYAFFATAMARIDQLMPEAERNSLLASCACCLAGQREKRVKQFLASIAGQPLTLPQRVDALRESGLFGAPRMVADDTIADGIPYSNGKGGWQCACPNFSRERRTQPISLTYCYCCAGHFQHHLQRALGVRLEPHVISSPLASEGQQPCAFTFTVLD